MDNPVSTSAYTIIKTFHNECVSCNIECIGVVHNNYVGTVRC
jgi:hypothetical protein